jgi:hypothetical protein
VLGKKNAPVGAFGGKGGRVLKKLEIGDWRLGEAPAGVKGVPPKIFKKKSFHAAPSMVPS